MSIATQECCSLLLVDQSNLIIISCQLWFDSFVFRMNGNWKPSDIDIKLYHSVADHALDLIVERMDLGDIEIPGMDVEYSDGVVNVNLGKNGIWVINKQSPNKQIWLSSPLSGPARYDFNEQSEEWVNSRDHGIKLRDVLQEEFSKVINHPVKFSDKF
jgi:frataxin